MVMEKFHLYDEAKCLSSKTTLLYEEMSCLQDGMV